MVHLILLLFLFIIAIIAAIVDTLAGGGGLITVPALLVAGLPPTLALGTNKLQACIGEANAATRFIHHGKIKLKSLLVGAIFTGIGSIIGTIVVQYIHPDILNKFIPIILALVLVYSIFSKRFVAEQSGHQYFSYFFFYLVFGLLIGFYNGFLGPGTGYFWIVAFIFFLGFDLKKAVLYGKPLNFIGNFVSLFCFIYAGLINYKIAIIMGIGQLIGSYIGAKLVFYKGAKIIRPVFIIMVLVMIISLLIKHFM